MTDLVLTPAACYPVYPAIAARGAAGRRAASPSTPAAPTSSATSPRATRPACRSSTSARSSGSASRRRSPRGATRWRDRSVELLRSVGLDADFDVANDPFFGRSGRLLARSQRSPGAEVRGAGPDRRPRADRGRLLQLPPGPLHRRPTGSRWRTAATGPHRLPRLRPRADRAGAAARARPRPRRLARRGAARSWGCDERRRRRRTGQPARARPGRLRARTRCTRTDRVYPETNCYTDILIELVHARGDEPLAMMGCALGGRLRGRPVDLLQAAPRGPRAPLRDRHPRDAALPAAAGPDRRADRGGADDRRSSSTPGTCPTPRRPATAPSTSRAR